MFFLFNEQRYIFDGEYCLKSALYVLKLLTKSCSKINGDINGNVNFNGNINFKFNGNSNFNGNMIFNDNINFNGNVNVKNKTKIKLQFVNT